MLHRLALLVALIPGLVACTSPHLGDSEAALVLEDLAARSGGSRLKDRTGVPVRESIRYRIDGRDREADLYLPADRTRAGIVLVPGIDPQGKDDRRLVALAYTLARAGFAVLAPDIPGPRDYRFRASDVREVTDAVLHLTSLPDLVPPGHAGIAGFSYGAGPVVLAALHPEIRERVGFILAVGGYHDMDSVITFFTTGVYGEAGRREVMEPHPYAKWVFAYSNAGLVQDPRDRAALEALAAEYLFEASAEEDTFTAAVSADGRPLYELLMNENAERVPDLIARLPPHMLAELRALSPAHHDLGAMRARAILLHGRGDNMIPYTESAALARALPAGQSKLVIIDGLAHVNIKPHRADLPLLLEAIEALLAERGP